MIDYTPTRLKLWTMPDDYFGEVWPNYYSAGVGQSRDSDSLEESNFACMLEALGGESDTVIVVRESHWAVGWIEWIAIHADDGAALKIADEIRQELDDYPVIDEDDWSDREWSKAADFWNSLSPRDRVQMALDERERYHWLANAPVWPLGRLDYSDLANHPSPIAQALCEQLRE